MNLEEWMRVALGFVLEDESWPVFYKWVETQPHSTTMQTYLDNMFRDQLRDELRASYLETSTRTLRD